MQVGRRPVSAKENQTESITGKVCANNMAKEFKLSAERLEELKKELQTFVKKQTAPYKYPRIVEFVTELPKTISGKIRRTEIRAKDQKK